MTSSIRYYRCMIALLALAGVVISYTAIVPAVHVSRMRLTTNFLSYFTIQSNVVLALALLAGEVAAASLIGRWARHPSVRTGLFLYVAVAGAVYVLILKDAWHPRGWQLRGDQILHYCIPILAALDWLFLAERGKLIWRDAIWWLGFPALYSAYTLVHGHVSGFYPYPFLDVGDIGLEDVLTNMALLAALFLALGCAFVLLDRIVAKFLRR